MLTGLKPREFTWVIADQLAVSERIGGYGFQHRRVRREEEIAWLVKEAGISAVVSLLPGPQNVAAYRDAGITTYQVPVGNEVDQETAREVFATLDKARTEPGAVVLVHREVIDDIVAGLLGGYLIASGLLTDRILAVTVIQEILGRALGPEARSLIPEPGA